MRGVLALTLLASCGTFVRDDSLAGPIYDECMERKMANRSDREADKACVEHARWKARAIMDDESTTTVCRHNGNMSVCKSD